MTLDIIVQNIILFSIKIKKNLKNLVLTLI